MKAVGYTRFATADQVDRSDAQEPQEKVINDYCMENSIELLRIFHDVGSGVNFNRETWKNLERYLADPANGVQLLLVSSLDRISRNYEQAMDKISFLETHYGIAVVFPKNHPSVDELFGRSIL